jgi:hypothetical protein
MWKALSARDWDGMKPFLSDDCIYYDVPVGPAAAARGPDDIVKRIRIAFDQLADYQNLPGLLLVNGSDAMYEHHEEWHWPTGEYAVNRFVTVHRAVMCRFAPWTRMCGGCAPSSARTHGC